jgi:membrane protease subunit HflC
MKNIGTILAAFFVIGVLALYMCSFQVRFTEVAIVLTFNEPAETPITEPGFYWKWPAPIQTVVRYDKRIRILEDRTEETRTVDGKNVMLTTYTLWRVKNPTYFHTKFPTGVAEAEKLLRTTITTHKHAVVGQHALNEFVSTDPNLRNINGIEEEIFALVKRDAERNYGMEIKDFGVKKLGLPKSVTTSIFASMKAHEQAKAAQYESEGEARAASIVASAKAVEGRIMAAARRKVVEIENEAERVVGEYYQEFNEYPELRIFLDKLRTAKEALYQRTTIIIDTSQSPWDVFDPAARNRVIEQKAAREQAAPTDGDAESKTQAARD